MKVHEFRLSGDEALTECKRPNFGISLSFRWGDWCHPLGSGNWFHEPYFTRIFRHYIWLPLPFICWNLWGWRGYVGCKVYGAECPDRPEDPGMWHWIPAADVYPGSQAIQLSIRLKVSD